MRKLLVLAGLLFMPSVATAQDAPQRGPGRAGPRMQINTVAWLLEQKGQFKPSGDQVAKLEEIAKALNDVTAKQREEMRKLRDEGMSGDRREAFQKMRPVMEQMRKQDEEATKEALKVLNDEQKKVVEDLIEARKKEMESRQMRRFQN